MLSIKDLYPHLKDSYIQENKTFIKNYTFDYCTDIDRDIFSQINSTLDVLQPLKSNGHRMSDIEALNSANGVTRDMLLNRLVPTNPDSSSTMSIPRNLSRGELLNAMSSIKAELDLIDSDSDSDSVTDDNESSSSPSDDTITNSKTE